LLLISVKLTVCLRSAEPVPGNPAGRPEDKIYPIRPSLMFMVLDAALRVWEPKKNAHVRWNMPEKRIDARKGQRRSAGRPK